MAEGKNLYETVIVTTAKLGEEGNTALVERFKALIAEHGTVQSVDDWGSAVSPTPSRSRPRATTP